MLNPKSLFSRRSHRTWLYPLLSLVMAVGVIVGTPLVSQAFNWRDLLVPAIQAFQLSNMSDQQEIQLGQQINQELITNQVQLYNNPDMNRYINQIGQRLAKNSARPKLPYTFQVVDDNAINAFATAGGFVYVNKGTIAAADNEAQLASVIGHEIGHIASRHALQDMRKNALEQGLIQAAGLDKNTAVQLGVQLALQLPNSRQHEYEADQKGLKTIGLTGYPQTAMLAFMQKLLSASSPPAFLSTHPAPADRITALKRDIDPKYVNNSTGLDSVAYKSKIRTLL